MHSTHNVATHLSHHIIKPYIAIAEHPNINLFLLVKSKKKNQ